MKKYAIALLVGFSLIAACNKKDEGGPVLASAPMNTNCLYTNCQGYAGGYGFSGTPYLHNNGQICGCPSGTQPVYNGSLGLSCVQSYYLSSYNYFTWNWGGAYFSWNSFAYPSVTGTYNGTSCYSSVTQACIVGQSCYGNGYYGYCRPLAGGTLGICTL